MKTYYKVIDNKWGDDCPCYGLDELDKAIELAQYAQASADEYKTMDHDGVTPFKVVILKMTSEQITF